MVTDRLQFYGIEIRGRFFSLGRADKRIQEKNSSCCSAIKGKQITINVPVVYMGRYEVVLRGDYP
jgi:hypothetical protein